MTKQNAGSPFTEWIHQHARLSASVTEVRYRNFPGRQEAADPRRCQGKARHRPGKSRALRPLQGQGVDGLRQVAAKQAERQADPGLRDHADAGRRRQDHDHGRPDRRAQLHRQEGNAVPARAVARAVVRHERRRRRRRLRPGGADGGHQSALHRRLPRHHLGEQSARGDARQSHLLGQRARHRRAPRRLAPRARHERPRAALRSSARSAASPTDFRARTVSTSRSPPKSWRSSASPAISTI